MPQIAVHPWRVRDDEHEAVFVVGKVDGDEEAISEHDPLPVDVQQGAPVPDLVEVSIDVGFLDEDDVAVVLPVVGLAGRCVCGDESLDEFLDSGMGGVGWGKFGEVFGGFECDHMRLPP